MGIQTLQLGEAWVISSDHLADGASRHRAPRKVSYLAWVWTGKEWSTERNDALHFDSIDAADEYVRANYVAMKV